MEKLNEWQKQAIWVAHTLFSLGKTSGSSANMSFRIGETVYISASGTCFGTLEENDFSAISMQNEHLGGKKPSKESPLHLALYEKDTSLNAVIHTHGTYAVLWSCLPNEKTGDCIPPYTPYLKMKLGNISLVPYEKPGSEALFQAFRESICKNNGYLLRQHGAIVAAESIMDAFYSLEELEESTRIAWELRNEKLQF